MIPTKIFDIKEGEFLKLLVAKKFATLEFACTRIPLDTHDVLKNAALEKIFKDVKQSPECMNFIQSQTSLSLSNTIFWKIAAGHLGTTSHDEIKAALQEIHVVVKYGWKAYVINQLSLKSRL
jgi:hypothetical protein